MAELVRNTPQILEPKIDALTFAMERLLTRITNLEQHPQQVQSLHNDERHLPLAGRVDPRCQTIQQRIVELGNINLEIPNFTGEKGPIEYIEGPFHILDYVC